MSNKSYLFIIKFGLWIIVTAQGYFSSFVYHVSHIIFWCTKKEMRRVTAFPVITFMTNKISFWNVAIRQYPGHSMSVNTTTKPKYSSSGRIDTCFPFPTFLLRQNIYLIPKSFHVILQYKIPLFCDFRFLSREPGLNTKQWDFIRKIKRPLRSLDNLIISLKVEKCNIL